MKRLLLSLSLFLALSALAQPQTAVPLAIAAPWMRPSVQGQAATGAYMTLTASEPLTLVGASSPAAGSVELHQMQMDGDVMRMRAVDALALAPKRPVQLSPGGYHLMVLQPKTPFRIGMQVPLTLRLRDAKGAVRTVDVAVPVSVLPPAGAGTGAAASEHRH
jgi:copper(I)-binding protein